MYFHAVIGTAKLRFNLQLALPNSDLIWSSPGIVGKITKNGFMCACTYSIVNMFIHYCHSAGNYMSHIATVPLKLIAALLSARTRIHYYI